MKIVNKANGQETTVSAAISIAVDGDSSALSDLVARLIEEMANSGMFRHGSLERLLGNGFEVTE